MGKKNKNALDQPNRHVKQHPPIASSAFVTVLLHCILIIVSPIVTFFGSKYFIFDSLLDLSSIQSNIWSAVVAVIALHLALGLFLYRAYFEADHGPTRSIEKED